MAVSYDEVSDILESIRERDFWDTKIELLTAALDEQFQKGVQEGLRLAALFSSGGLVSPNSFAASCAKDDDVDNSDDLYVNA